MARRGRKGGGRGEGAELGLCKHSVAIPSTCVWKSPGLSAATAAPAVSGRNRKTRKMPLRFSLEVFSVLCVWKWNGELRAKPMGRHCTWPFLWDTSSIIRKLIIKV